MSDDHAKGQRARLDALVGLPAPQREEEIILLLRESIAEQTSASQMLQLMIRQWEHTNTAIHETAAAAMRVYAKITNWEADGGSPHLQAQIRRIDALEAEGSRWGQQHLERLNAVDATLMRLIDEHERRLNAQQEEISAYRQQVERLVGRIDRLLSRSCVEDDR